MRTRRKLPWEDWHDQPLRAYPVEVTDDARQPVAIRIARPYASEDAFLENELDTLTRTSVILIGAQSRPQGVVLRFEVTLASGAPLLRGEGRVVAYKPSAYNNEPGLTLRFTRLDPRSKALVDRAAALRDARGRGGRASSPNFVQIPPPIASSMSTIAVEPGSVTPFAAMEPVSQPAPAAAKPAVARAWADESPSRTMTHDTQTLARLQETQRRPRSNAPESRSSPPSGEVPDSGVTMVSEQPPPLTNGGNRAVQAPAPVPAPSASSVDVDFDAPESADFESTTRNAIAKIPIAPPAAIPEAPAAPKLPAFRRSAPPPVRARSTPPPLPARAKSVPARAPSVAPPPPVRAPSVAPPRVRAPSVAPPPPPASAPAPPRAAAATNSAPAAPPAASLSSVSMSSVSMPSVSMPSVSTAAPRAPSRVGAAPPPEVRGELLERLRNRARALPPAQREAILATKRARD